MTILTKQQMISILSQLANKGNTYTCEAQFQHDLVDALRTHFLSIGVGYNIYLEYPCSFGGRTEYYDIVIEDTSATPHEYCVIELKYKTKASPAMCYGQGFTLKTHGAQGLGRYDYLHDVARIEQFSKRSDKKMQNGYAVLLTNDSLYWTQNGQGRSYNAFSLCNGSTQFKGHKGWSASISPSSVGIHRINGFDLAKTYNINWNKWSSNPNFEYLLLEI